MSSPSDLSPKTPKGKNSTHSTLELYNEKSFYYDNVYPGGDLPWLDKPFDFINENPLYGKVNLDGDYIIPKYKLIDGETQYERIVEVSVGTSGVRAFDFVVEAFNDLKTNIESLVKTSWLAPGGPIAKFEAKKGFVDFEVMNKLQKEVHYYLFVSEFLSKPSTINNNFPYKELLHNASDFTNFFLLYLKSHTKTMPFTKGGIINSFYMAPMSTGLCLEIDDALYDDDNKKHTFLKDPNFDIYRIAARRYGFMVDRNVPWRLVADVRSLKMREYMRLAYERKAILEGREAVLEARRAELQLTLPEFPTLNDLFTHGPEPQPGPQPSPTPGETWADYIGGPWFKKDFSKYSWSNEALKEFDDQTQKQLQDVINSVSEKTKDFWVFKDLYNAKNPSKDVDGIQMCAGEFLNKTCTSRVFKFEKFFEAYYDVPYTDEVEDIKKTFYKFFVSYYVQNPIVKKRVLCSAGSDLQTKMTTKEIELELINEEQYNVLYTDYYWLKTYFDIKLAENNISFKPMSYNKHIKKIIDLSTLNSHDKANLSGTTSKDASHTHQYQIDINGNGWALETTHPQNPNQTQTSSNKLGYPASTK
jgi:hypothetical protein